MAFIIIREPCRGQPGDDGGTLLVPLVARPPGERLRIRIRGVTLDRDWLAPRSSLQGLVARMHRASASLVTLGRMQLGTDADHFAWMRAPAGVVETLAGQADVRRAGKPHEIS